jgi:nitrogen regulatory protein P-II 2
METDSGMKLITANVRPHCIDDVRTAVALMGLDGMTVSEIEQHGQDTIRTEVYRGAEYRSAWEAWIRIELAVNDDLADQVIEAICNIARTGRRDDGSVFVTALLEAVRIRTGETGPFAV